MSVFLKILNGIPTSAQVQGTDIASGSATSIQVLAADGSGNSLFRSLAASDIPSLSTTYLALVGGTMSGAIAMNNYKITGLGSGSVPGDAVQFGQIGSAFGAASLDGNGKLPLSEQSTIGNNTILGNNTGSTGSAIALTQSQVTAILNPFSSTLQGVVPASGGGTSNFLRADGTWAAPIGSVTSVAFSDASTTPIYAITGSPVTSSGTLTQTLTVQNANTVFAGPSSGSPAQPSFRSIVAADIPTLNQNTTGTAANITATSNSTLTTLSALSLPGTQVTGTVPAATSATSATTAGTATNFSGSLSGDVTGTQSSTSVVKINGAAVPTSKTIVGTNSSGQIIDASSATLSNNTSGTASNVTATSNSTLTTLSALSLPGTQVTGNISGNAGNITATSNSTLTTLSALSLPGTQVTGTVPAATSATSATTAGTATNFSGSLSGDVTGTQSSTSVVKINGTSLASLATGLLKNTTGTGVPTIAVAGTDYVIPSGNITGTSSNITATSNSTLTTLSALSLPGTQVTGNISGNAANITATSNSTLTTLSALSLPYSQVTGAPAVGANTSLSNLSSTSINASLFPNTDNTYSLGSSMTGWSGLYLSSGAQIFSGGTTIFNYAAGGLYFGPSSGAGGSGTSNVAFGNNTLTSSYGGNNNSAFGSYALGNQTNPNNNTAVGANAGAGISTGGGNTFIGAYANTSTGTITNATAIGYRADVEQSNAIVLGGTGTYAVNVGIGTTTPSTSALLTLVGGTASVAPLIIGAGTNLTSAVSGAIENNGTSLFYTNSSGTRLTLATTANQTSAPTANTVMLRDSNGNVQVNSINESITTTATAAGTTTLTVSSTYYQQFTGTTTQTVVLPNATTLINGQAFSILNRSTGIVTVNANGGGLIQSVAAGNQVIVTLVNNGTSAGTWDAAYTVSSGSGGFTNPMTTAGDIIVGGAAGAAQRLGVGSTGQVLTVASGTPSWSTPTSTTALAPQITTYLSGSGTYTVPAGALYITVEMVGGGGGGAGGSATGGTGGTGGSTTFGTSLLVANGGVGATGGGGIGGTGGTASLGSGPTGISLSGAQGGAGGSVNATATNERLDGGYGAGTRFAGSSSGGSVNNTGSGVSALANTGAGGGGGAGPDATGAVSWGGGGGAGGYVLATINSLLSSYSYSVGSGGTAGTAGTGSAGGAGGSGIIVVTAYFSAGQSSAISGTATLSSSATSVTVSYPSSLSSSSYQLICSFSNSVDSSPEFQPITVTSKTAAGFTATWNSPLPTGNYKLDYAVMGLNTSSIVVSNTGKNYLTPMTTSNGVNSGNGNFELASTVNWSLAHSALSTVTPTSVASAGNAFSSSSGGSTASANLSLNLVSSNQISGSYSGSLISTTASTAGDMLVSKAFYIDNEDKAKMMQGVFYFSAVSGTYNFSGTSSNTFAVWVYDVTNAAWIQPAGVYNLTQGSGIGKCTFTFQTTSNSNQYQIALININATAAAYTLYVDDFSVGPQIAPTGPAASDMVAYTPTLVGFGTVTNLIANSGRFGDKLFVSGSFTAGTTTATTASISLGYNGVNGNVTTDNSGKLSAVLQAAGTAAVTSENGNSILILVAANQTVVNFGLSNASLSSGAAANGNNIGVSGNVISFNFSVPIQGWSSNTSMSSDTDTRVVAAYGNLQTPTGTISGSQNVIKFGTVTKDTHAAYNTSTGLYTVPVTGWYQTNCLIQITGTYALNQYVYVGIQQNGTAVQQGGTIAGGANSTEVAALAACLYCNAGDTLNFYSVTQATGTSYSAGNSQFSIYRVSGPAVVAATESVNARYNGTSSSPSNNTTATIVFSTKNRDTHNAYNTTTGVYTVPVSGMYQVNATVRVAGTISLNSQLQLGVVQNSSNIYTSYSFSGGAQSNIGNTLNDMFPFNAGDQITISGEPVSVTGPSYVLAYFSIARVGN